MVYLWMPMVVLGVVRLLYALIEWRTRISYERARAASIVDVLRAVPEGVVVRDCRADGTVISIEIPGYQQPSSGCAHGDSRGKNPC